MPHYVTSNPTIANRYAEIVLAFWRDRQRLAPQSEPLTICELGAGSARFAFHFLRRLSALCAQAEVPPQAFRYEAIVETTYAPDAVAWSAPQLAVDELPDDVLVYTLPSRYCQSDQLADRAWELFGSVAPGWPLVQAICDYVNGALAFGYGSSTSATSAVDALAAVSATSAPRDRSAARSSAARRVRLRRRRHHPLDAPMTSPVDRGLSPRSRGRSIPATRTGRKLTARGRDFDVAMVTTAATLHEMVPRLPNLYDR